MAIKTYTLNGVATIEIARPDPERDPRYALPQHDSCAAPARQPHP